MQLYQSGEYRASKEWPYAICAGCVVYRHSADGYEVLLLFMKKADSAGAAQQEYHLPKGHMDIGETLEQAALRETSEEAGVSATVQTYLGTRFWAVQHPVHKIQVEKTVHYFAAKWQADLEFMDDEHDGKEWVSLDKAEQLLGAPNPKGEDEIIRRLKTFLELAT